MSEQHENTDDPLDVLVSEALTPPSPDVTFDPEDELMKALDAPKKIPK